MTVRRSRSSLLLVALALAAAGALWLASRPRAPAPAAPPAAEAADEERATADVALADASERVESPAARESSLPASVERLEASSDAPQPSAAAGAATLVARCVDATSGAPLAGVRVYVMPYPLRSGSVTHVDGTSGTLTTSPVTGDEGVVEFELPAGGEFSLTAAAASGARVELEVEPLAAGERRELRVAIPSGDDLAYHGRVVDAEGGAPLAGASVELLRTSRTSTSVDGGKLLVHYEETLLAQRETGPDGLFELSIASWMEPIVRVRADGYTPAFVEVGDGHEALETARAIPLRRAASLRARLVDERGLALLDATVRLRVEARELGLSHHGDFFFPELPDSEWERLADGSGTCAFDALPSGVPLDVEIELPGGAAAIARSEPSLAPGEAREVEWSVGGGCTVGGVARDERGDPVGGVRVWLSPAVAGASATYFTTYLENGSGSLRQERTAADGRFAFRDVATGTWWLGPAAEREDWEPASERLMAPLARVVEVPAGVAHVEADVDVHRGLYVEGRVLDPAGEPVGEAYVLGIGDNGAFASAESDDEGAFALGPLAPGRYELLAQDHFHASSESFVASAGDDGVVLRLTPAGQLRGRVVDAASGEGCAAQLAVALQGAEGALSTSTEDDGSFRVEGLEPGTYVVTARGSSARFGMLRAVPVIAGRDTPDVVLTLVPGARLRLDNRSGSTALWYRVTLDGAEVDVDVVPAGQSPETVVAPGRLAVVVRWPDRERSFEVELAPGETKTLDLSHGD